MARLLALAAIRRSAAQLKAANQQVTITTLAASMSVTVVDLRPYLEQVCGLSEEIGLIQSANKDMHATLCKLYSEAAARLRERNELVTVRTLAAETNKTEHVVRVWLGRHKADAASLGVVTEAQAKKARRMAAYQQARDKLERTGGKVTIAAITRLAGVERTQYFKDLR